MIARMRIRTNKTYTLSPSFNDANPKIFHCKRFDSVKILQSEFDTMDFTHFHDLYRWNFPSSLLRKMLMSFLNHARHAASQLQ